MMMNNEVEHDTITVANNNDKNSGSNSHPYENDTTILGLDSVELADLRADRESLNESVHSIDPLQPENVYRASSSFVDVYGKAIVEQPATLGEYIRQQFKGVWSAQLLVFKYVRAEAKRHKRSFFTGWFTVFLVVLFVSLLMNSVTKSPIVFFKLAENTVGENDLVMTPGLTVDMGSSVVMRSSVFGLPLLNHSIVNTTMEDIYVSTGTAPRIVLVTKVTKPNSDVRPATAVLLGINTRQEDHIGYGREWHYPPLDANEVVLSRTIVRQIGMDPLTAVGRDLVLGIGLADMLQAAGIDVERDNVTSVRDALFGIVPGLEELWNSTVTVDLDPNNLPFGLNLTAFELENNFTVNDLNVTLLLNALESALEPLLNVTLNLNETEAVRFLEGLNIPGIGNITTLLQELLNGLQANVSRVTFDVHLAPLLDDILPFLIEQIGFSAVVNIHGIVESPLGKWPASLGSVVVMDTYSLVEDLKAQVYNLLHFEGNLTGFRFQIRTLTGFDVVNDVAGAFTNETRRFWEGFWKGDDVFDPDGTIMDGVNSVNADEVAFTSTVQHRDRVSLYIGTLEEMHHAFVQFSNIVAEQVGISYPATVTLPIDATLQQTKFLRYFLDNIFGATIALVVVLGMMLIYSLLLSDVQERNYEYGMLRALGMKQRTLIQLLLTKSMLFAIPGIGVGLFVSFLCNIPIAIRMANFAVISPDYSMSEGAIVAGVCIGLIMPLIANIVPISRALSSTLRDSLDIYHQVVNDIVVRVQRLANVGVDMWQTSLGVLLVVVGFITYYMIPYAFTFRKFGLFLAILNGILLGMLFGLCLIASVIQPFLERLVLQGIVWGKHRSLLSVTRKNLAGHRHRNKKTAQMFTVCLAFVIFAGVMFELQARSLSDNVRVFFGSDLLITAPTMSEALNEAEMTVFLEQQMEYTRAGDPRGTIAGYTFMTFPLHKQSSVLNTRVANLPGYPSVRNFVFGVQENYLDVAYDEYYMPTEVAKNVDYPQTPMGKDDAIKIMWTDAGNARLPEEEDGIRLPQHATSGPPMDSETFHEVRSVEEYEKEIESAYTNYIDVVVSEALRSWMSITVQSPLSLRVRFTNPSRNFHRTVYYLCKARGLARKVPGFFFSSYAPTAFFSSVIIKEEHYKRLLKDANEFADLDTDNLAPKMRLLVKVVEGTSQDQREDIINSLRTFFKSDATIALDTEKVVSNVATAVDLLNLFFTVVGVIAMILCFFILWLSFTANVRENAWEFGVLRAVGLNTTQVVMVYIYEALSLVLSSLLLGTTIGIVIAISLTLQFNLFLEMPFRFAFPHLLFWTITGMALCVAVVGSFLPAYSYMKHSVAHVLRHT